MNDHNPIIVELGCDMGTCNQRIRLQFAVLPVEYELKSDIENSGWQWFAGTARCPAHFDLTETIEASILHESDKLPHDDHERIEFQMGE